MAEIVRAERCTPAEAASELIARVEAILRGGASQDSESGRLARVEVRFDGLTPLEWLRAQPDFTQYYWSERDDDFEMAGVGEADVLAPVKDVDLPRLFAHIRSRLSADSPSLRYYGGFRFRAATRDKGERWRAFKAYRFVVPRFEVLRRPGGTYLVCNMKVGHARTNAQTLESIVADLARIRMEPLPPPRPPRVVSRTDSPDAAGWRALVQKALDDIAAKKIDKVVLARETLIEGDAPWDPVTLLSQVASQTQRSFEFCFHPAPDRAFIGASPERLFRRVNCWLRSEAIAGTRPRGKTDEADERLGEALLHNEKELREHDHVVRMLHEKLGVLCHTVTADAQPSILRLKYCQHLYTKMEGLLNDESGDAALLAALHPTPAVGGAPRAEVLAWLDREEPFDRGIYAAPVGWVGYDESEFCVGIRSGLVQGKTLALYNGAGIVPGSLPDEEWDELEQKMAGFMAVLPRHGA